MFLCPHIIILGACSFCPCLFAILSVCLLIYLSANPFTVAITFEWYVTEL